MPEIITPGTEEHEEEEEEEEAVPALPPRGLCSRGSAVLAEGEPAGQFTVGEGAVVAERPEEMTKRAEVEILSQLGISIRSADSSAQERGMEAQQLGSPSVMMPSSRVVEPSPTTRVLSGKAPITEDSLVQVSSSSSEEHIDYLGDEVDFGDELALPDTSKFLYILEEEMQVYVLAMVPQSGEVTTNEGISSIPLNYFPMELGKYFNTSFEFLLQEWLPVLSCDLLPY